MRLPPAERVAGIAPRPVVANLQDAVRLLAGHLIDRGLRQDPGCRAAPAEKQRSPEAEQITCRSPEAATRQRRTGEEAQHDLLDDPVVHADAVNANEPRTERARIEADLISAHRRERSPSQSLGE